MPESRLHLDLEIPPLKAHQEVQPEQVAVSAEHLVIMVSPVQLQTTYTPHLSFSLLLVIFLVAAKLRPLTFDFTTDKKSEVRGLR